MNLGYKHMIDNDGSALSLLNGDVAGTVIGDTTDIHLLGLDKFPVGAIKNAVIHRAVPGSVMANTITIAGANTAAGAADVTLQLEIFSDRDTADYSRKHQDSGKLVSFTARVAASATATVIADALAAVIAARETKYADLPFTVDAVSDADIVLTGKAGMFYTVAKLAYDAVKVISADSQTRIIAAVSATEVVTAPAPPVNDGAWIEENIAMNTGEAVRTASVKPLEAVNRAAVYTSLYFEVDFSSDMIAEPSVVGQVSQSGTVKVGLYLNEAAAPTAVTDAYAVLTEILLTATGGIGYEEDGSELEGATIALDVDDFWGLGGAGDVAVEV